MLNKPICCKMEKKIYTICTVNFCCCCINKLISQFVLSIENNILNSAF